MKTIGIIGFGNFGRFAASHLKAHFDVCVCGEGNVEADAKKAGVKAVSLDEVAACDVVLLCVPVQSLESVLENIEPHLKKDAWVVDVCSVKQKPADLMEKSLPKTVQIIGTHPLFGPQSGKNGIAGLQIVICPIRAEKAAMQKATKFLSDQLGLQVVKMTPNEHDEWMARTQAVAHYVGRAAKELDLPQAPFRLATYDALLALRDLVKDDSDALFDTIQNENPHAAGERKKFESKLAEIGKRLESRKAAVNKARKQP